MEELKSKTCCFTGHRNIPTDKLPMIYHQVENEIKKLIENGYLYFGSGGARGFDTISAEVVLRLKKYYPQIRLILVLPCLEHTPGWAESDLQKHEYIIKNSDKVVYTSHKYTKDCMHKRNRHLVDNSSAGICYLNRM